MLHKRAYIFLRFIIRYTVFMKTIYICHLFSNVGYAKEVSYQRSTSQQTLPKQATSTMVHTIPGKVEATQTTDRTKQNFQAPVLLHQIPLNQMNPVFPTEARSLADLNTSGLGTYLSSSICSSFVPQKDLLKSQSNPPANQNMLQDGSLLPAQLAMAQGQQNNISPKFLTGIVDCLLVSVFNNFH